MDHFWTVHSYIQYVANTEPNSETMAEFTVDNRSLRRPAAQQEGSVSKAAIVYIFKLNV